MHARTHARTHARRGAFCPLFRLHGARSGPTWPAGKAGVCGQDASNEVWMFGDESEAAIVKVMRIREQMRPYVMEQYYLYLSIFLLRLESCVMPAPAVQSIVPRMNSPY